MTTTIETGALNTALRTLKLSGMLETIEARLAQARAGELGAPRVWWRLDSPQMLLSG